MTALMRGWRGAGRIVGHPARLWWPSPRSGPSEGVLHGASAGEVKAARALRGALPQPGDWTFTTGTPAGLAAGAAGRLPRDVPSAIRAFFEAVRPQRIVLVEGELWPTLLVEAAARGVPVGVAGARVSERSLQRWRRAPRSARQVFGLVTAFAAASAGDAERLRSLGVAPSRVAVGGWLKWSAPPAQVERDRRHTEAPAGEGPLVVAGSVHPGELRALAGALGGAGLDPASFRWVVVPRHPRALPRLRREAAGLLGPAVRWEGRFGLLSSWYATADLAFVGGGAAGRGVHDLLEPLAVGRRPLHFAARGDPGGASQVLVRRGLALRLDGATPGDPREARIPPATAWTELSRELDGRAETVRILRDAGVLPPGIP